MLPIASLPDYECKTESDVEQKFIYPLLVNSAFLAIPPKSILSKRSLGTFKFVDKSTLPKNYVPDYVLFFDGLPACVIEAKEPNISAAQAIQEARLYSQILNQQFPTGSNPVETCIGCNGIDFAIGSTDTNEFRTFSVNEILVGSGSLRELQALVSVERLSFSTSRAKRSFTPPTFRRPSRYLDRQLFLERIRPNSLSPYLHQINEMFFRAEDPEKIKLILDKAYVDTADLREYDNVLQSMLKQIEKRSEQKTILTDPAREYTLSPEITRYESEPSQGRLHLVIGSRGSGKSLFIARFFSHLFPERLKKRAAWLIVDFNRAPEDLGNIEEFLFGRLIEDVQNLGFDQFHIDGLNKIFSVEINRLNKGALSLLKDEVERERKISNELFSLSNDRVSFGRALSRYIVGDAGRPLIVAFDNVDRRRSEQQLAIFQAAQSFRSAARAFSLLTLRDTTYETFKDDPPLDTYAQINNFYIRPPRFSLVLQERLKLALEYGLHDVAEIEQTAAGGTRFIYSPERLRIFLTAVYKALFSDEFQVGKIVDALAERDVRDALGMFARILSSGHFDADHVIKIGIGGQSKTPRDQLIKILMRADYKLFSDRSGFLTNVFWLPETNHSGNIFLCSEVLGFFAVRSDAGQDKMTGYWRLEEVLADLASMGFEEAEIRSVVNHLVEKRLLAYDGEISEQVSESDLIKLTPSGFIHLRSLPQFMEYISSVCLHAGLRDDAVARRIGSVWGRTSIYPDLDFTRKHDVASLFSEYLIREKARLDGQNPIFAERAREAEEIVRSVTQTVNATASVAASIRDKRLKQNRRPSAR